jgi:uncharacterized membrane-anchored protein
MNSVSFSNSWRLVSKDSRISWFFALLLISTSQLCRGDVVSSIPPALPQQEKSISTATDKATLGDYANIEVPQGYRFIDAETARVMLEQMNSPVAPGLVGVIAPESRKWWAVLEFNETGYVKDVDERADAAAILKAVRDRNDAEQRARPGMPHIASVDWAIEPKYDANAHTLEWAFYAEAPNEKIVNHTLVLFSRRGVLSITGVQPNPTSPGQVDSVPLNELAKSITFKEGQRYDDYQSGDKVASVGLKELVVGAEPAAGDQAVLVGNSVPRNIILLCSILGGCVAVGSGLLVYGKLKKRKAPSVYTYSASRNGKNGSALSHNGGSKQRRVFDYHRFYADMVKELSGHTYAWVSSGNGNGNGHSRSRATVPAVAPQAAPAVASQTVANANSELIACQKSLIEEQKNLMREQARIIEEKAKLIAEYNRLMEKWSDDQFSLKLD